MSNWIYWLSVILVGLAIMSLVIMAIQYTAASPEGKEEIKKVSPQYIVLSISLFALSGSLSALSRALTSGSGTFLAIFMMSSSLLAILRFFSVHEAIIAFIAKKMPFLNAEANDLIARLLAEKNKKNLMTYFALFVSFLAEYVIYRKTQESSMLIAMALTFVMLALNYANQQIAYYRLKHGLYGTCYSEAKEIVSFILDLQRKNSDSNGKPPKLVFTHEELNECLQVNGGEEYAG